MEKTIFEKSSNPQGIPDVSVQAKVFSVWLLGDATIVITSHPKKCAYYEIGYKLKERY